MPQFMDNLVVGIYDTFANTGSNCLHQQSAGLQNKDKIMTLSLESQIPCKVTDSLNSAEMSYQRPIICDHTHEPQLYSNNMNTSKHNQGAIHLRPWVSIAIMMDNFSTYTNYDYGFTLRYPSNWSFEEINKYNSDNDLVVARFFPDAIAKDLLNVSILVDESAVSLDLNGYTNERMDKYKKSSASDSISRSVENSHLALHPAYKLSFSERGPENRRLNAIEIGTVVGGSGFIVRSTAIDNQLSQYQKDIEVIVNSFRLLGHPL
jgi:hypothetical protein